ncbi:MAG TPA: YfbM family protein [Abditibacterium sp.]
MKRARFKSKASAKSPRKSGLTHKTDATKGRELMSCLGVLFALTNADVKKLLLARQSVDRDAETMAIVEGIEERWDEKWLFELDKGWDAIHRCLADGQLEFEGGEYPLNHCIFGGTQLYEADDYIIFLKSSEQVGDVAQALKEIDEMALRGRYLKIESDTYDGELGEDDFSYTWSCFEGLPEFFAKAAKAKRSVMFTVDQ